MEENKAQDEQENEQQNRQQNGKSVGLIVLFVFSLALLVMGSVFLALRMQFTGVTQENFIGVGSCSVVIGILLMVLAHYLSDDVTTKRGAAVWVLTFLQYYIVLGVFMLGASIFYGGKNLLEGAAEAQSNVNKVEAKDEDGDTHKLTQDGYGSRRYKDEDGDYWRTDDGGKTFKRD